MEHKERTFLRNFAYNLIQRTLKNKPMATQESKFFTLGWNDIKKGLIMAAIGGAVAVLSPALTAGTIFTMVVLKAAGLGAATGAVTYLIKNLLTNSNDEFMTFEPKQLP